ncbi:AraC family transcriptional regulator [Chryseobacterium sp. 09-1422]|uniref:AraC family transcriptional regulator n=1 Tax=Chryseobacterium kimseyorum TaxID=2984028 RepID=A0ABT3I3J6_9FLAO|nr:helix-turn-helix domain-containing protein [Chryseobacterium kimseyorum]MCW3170598.1 AraC family transcriptional regulator [Chryseobacterium kimseyorum]
MIRILTEEIFVDSVVLGDSFHPSNFAFICVYVGEITISVNNVSHQCDYGNLLLLSPNNLYKVESHTGNLKMFVLSFEREKLRSQINFKFNRYDVYQIAQMENRHTLEITDLEFDHLKQLLTLANYYSASDTDHKFKSEVLTGIVTSVIYIITSFLLINENSSQQKNLRKEDITISFLELISKHFKEKKELSFYAESLLISVKYLSNCVREITKSPPTSFIADALMNEAKIMLLHPNNTVGMIAGELGFSDQYSFGKFFKKHTGLSPMNFRKRNHLIDPIF